MNIFTNCKPYMSNQQSTYNLFLSATGTVATMTITTMIMITPWG